MRAIALCAFGLLSPLFLRLSVTAESSAKLAPPRLAVLIVVDQLRGDYLPRWRELFGPNGFRRLERDGASYENCHYPYAATATGPGHASLATGCCPAIHGIVGNEWFESKERRTVNCVDSDRHSRVPGKSAGLASTLSSGRSKGGISPERLLVPTLADAVKKATSNKGRVVSLSLKDRSAVLPGGRTPDACYWFDTHTGEFVTSTYYRDTLHPWVEEFNRSRPADKWFGKDWTRLMPSIDYDRHSGADDVAGEGTGIAQGKTFPHPMAGGLKQPGRAFYEAATFSPAGNDLLFELLKTAVEREQLGQRGVSDLLCVSFSANDLVGHVWGPDSHEVLDITLRTDRLISELLTFLDSRVGRGNYVLALSSDHGICRLPEVVSARGAEAGRVDLARLIKNAEAFLSQRFKAPASTKWFEPPVSLWIDLNRQALTSANITAETAASALAEWLKQQVGIQAVYTRAELQSASEDDPLKRSVKRCYFAERCGDLFVIQKPHYLFASTYWTGTTHGTPHAYDTHVPLLFFGPGVRPGIRADEAVTPLCVAAAVAQALGIDPPEKMEYEVPRGLFDPK